MRNLTNLREAALNHDCTIHACVLMTNHVHLLVTPQARGKVSRMMQALGRRYVSCVNITYRRTGTLWEGRYKTCLVDSADYVLACHRYIELNPVRAAMLAAPDAYRWSSYHHNAKGDSDPLLTTHSDYHALASNQSDRQSAYRALLRQAISNDRLAEIRACLQQQRVLGPPRFQNHIEAILGRRSTIQPRGRPKTPDKSL